ncbi:hypothetical protein CSC2_42970 [Clostridium zeae]|uniref:DUF624 domain-containing protein n=1 Tax=Clostridium zeae TaxID=2759022 RepID=A0ABQ1EGG5_9CLOT|nr:DUF624 domain-containing protein [Clostridium zeae]GFZ33771.1 hypothetical protein CSC2_42970 [Clostridium zeae]
MKVKKEFGEGPIFTATNYIWWFLVGNFYFWLLNVPMLLVVLGIISTVGSDNTVLFIITLLPMAPALTALLSSMGKVIREKDIDMTKEFFKAYKTNFVESVFFAFFEVVTLGVLYFDRVYFAATSSTAILQMAILVMAIIFLAIINFYILPIVSRFYLKKMQIVKLAILYFFRRIHIAAAALAILYLLWTISLKGGSIILLFSASILCYIVMLFHTNTLTEIEARLQPEDGNGLDL